MEDDEFLECLCQVVTTPDHFKGLYKYLKGRNLILDFLANGKMVVVKGVIVGTDILKTGCDGECDSIYDAIALSLNEARHDRVASLFEAAHARPKWKDMFDMFMRGFTLRYPPEKNSMPLKRFLTLHGKEFSKQHPEIFDNICQRLVRESRWKLDNPASQRLLIDLAGQPSLLTPLAFALGFLYDVSDTLRLSFIQYGYKEALEEGLKEQYYDGGEHLWNVMMNEYSNQFFGEYPNTDEARSAALKNFKPTKQDLEEAWAKKNALNFQEKVLARLNQYLDFIPSSLVTIIYGYTTIPATWLDVGK